MPATVVIGGQWGDEGKGRVVDLLAREASIVARYSAGNNAGHTIINDYGLFALHIVPAGIFYADKTCVVGNGLVIDPAVLLAEIESLQSRGVSTANLRISDRAHVIMPWHPLIDRADEALRGPLAIGTTGRGVGPAFADKVGRAGMRMSDLVAMQPNLNIPLYLVAPDERRHKVFAEVNRPTFSRLSPPLVDICRYISFSALRSYLEQASPFVRYLKPDFLDELSESCGIEDA